MWCDGGYMILTFFGDLACRVSPVVCLEFGGDGMDLAIVASLVIHCFDSQHLCLSLKQRPKQSEYNGICSEKVRHFMWSLRIAIFQCLKVLDCQLASHLLLHNVFYWRSTSLRVLKRKHTCHQLMSLYILTEQLDRRPTIFLLQSLFSPYHLIAVESQVLQTRKKPMIWRYVDTLESWSTTWEIVMSSCRSLKVTKGFFVLDFVTACRSLSKSNQQSTLLIIKENCR